MLENAQYVWALKSTNLRTDIKDFDLTVQTIQNRNFKRPTFPMLQVSLAGAVALIVLVWALLTNHSRMSAMIDDVHLLEQQSEALEEVQNSIQKVKLHLLLAGATQEAHWEESYSHEISSVEGQIQKLKESLFGKSELSQIDTLLRLHFEIRALESSGLRKKQISKSDIYRIIFSPKYERLEAQRAALIREIANSIADRSAAAEKNQSEQLSRSLVLALFSFLALIAIGIVISAVTLSWQKTMNVMMNNLESELEKRTVEMTLAIENQARSSKLATLGEMASSISHEIRNPLGIISGHAENLLDELKESQSLTGEMALSGLQKILSMTERISKIIKGLSTLSRNDESEALLSTNLSTVINDAVEICAGKLRGSKIKLTKDLQGNDPVMGRDAQLCQVITNLLSNAIDAVVSQENPWIRIESKKMDGFVKVIVTDSGPGITEEMAMKILAPFFTTKEKGKGTGLGLSISRQIIADHGGHFEIDTKAPNTTFWFTVPVHRADDQAKSA